MEETNPLPPPLQNLITRGYLRRIDDAEFAIDPLRHRAMTGWGWETLIYTLQLDRLEGVDFEIIQDSEYSGDDSLLATSDPEEIETWIVSRIDEV